MRKFFDIKDISIYRSELMGWSIIWIMMLHFTFNQIKPLGFVAQYGFAGVDIFMLVSGLGIYYSLHSNHNLLQFYKKRLLRIFPTYYILGLFASILLFHDNIIEYICRYSTIGFWTGGIYWEWYIPSIVILYLLSPIIKYIMDKKWFIPLFCLCISILVITYYIINQGNILDRVHFFLLYRIPAFILGMVCAFWIRNNISTKYYHLFLLAGIPFFCYFFPQHHQFYNYKYFSLLFLLPLFAFIFILISKHFKYLNPIIKMIGNASLEIYLVQSLFFYAIIIDKIIVISPIWHDTITLFLIVMCSIMGITIHWAINKCFSLKAS